MRIYIFIVAAFLSISPAFAWAEDSLLLDPARTTCRITAGEGFRNTSARCDVYFDDLVVHHGRMVSIVSANGDCVKCRSVLEDAIVQRERVLMFRGYCGNGIADWDMDEFFTVNGSGRRTCE